MAFVEVTKKDHIAVVTMNRPEALNALNTAVFNELEPLVGEIERDATTWKGTMRSMLSSSPAQAGHSSPAPTSARWHP